MEAVVASLLFLLPLSSHSPGLHAYLITVPTQPCQPPPKRRRVSHTQAAALCRYQRQSAVACDSEIVRDRGARAGSYHGGRPWSALSKLESVAKSGTLVLYLIECMKRIVDELSITKSDHMQFHRSGWWCVCYSLPMSTP